MKLNKIIDGDNIQAYHISNPSKIFKRRFPKKYLIHVIVNNSIVNVNLDIIPNDFIYNVPTGYIFTYEKTLPKFLLTKIEKDDFGNTFPTCLDVYFNTKDNDKKKTDLIISCSAKYDIMPSWFNRDLIVRCNSGTLSDNLKSSSAIRKNILKIMNESSETYKCTEEWLLSLLDNTPLNFVDLPIRYPNTITDEIVSKKNNCDSKIIDSMFFGYDFRAEDYEHENKFISLFESAFENLNRYVTVYESYNGIVGKIKSALNKSKKIKYKSQTKYSITLKLKDLRDLNVEYQLNDFI